MQMDDSIGDAITLGMYGDNFYWNGVNNLTSGCYWNFQDLGNATSQVWIGEAFFQQWFTVFDIDNSLIGFGVSSIASGLQPFVMTPAGISTLAIVSFITADVLIIAFIIFVVIKKKQKDNQHQEKDDHDNGTYNQ
jgi:large-conductance mechanosensitive channel